MSFRFLPYSCGVDSNLATLPRLVQVNDFRVLNSDTKQLAIAIARLFGKPRDLTFHLADQQALTSLLTFIAGTSIGRIGDRIGPRRRIWLVFGTFLQALLLMIASICLWKSGQASIASSRAVPSWTNALTFVALGFMSASLGLQAILGKRLNTQFGTSGMYARPL